jgi:hypothetical protein
LNKFKQGEGVNNLYAFLLQYKKHKLLFQYCYPTVGSGSDKIEPDVVENPPDPPTQILPYRYLQASRKDEDAGNGGEIVALDGLETLHTGHNDQFPK